MSRTKALLLGDIVCGPLRDRLSRLLSEDDVEVVCPGTAGEDGAGFRAVAAGGAAEALVHEHEPDIACFSAGPWPRAALLKVIRTRDGLGMFEPQPLAAYEQALLDAVRVLQGFCGRQVVFVTAPPINEQKVDAACGEPGFGHRLNTWIAQYNQAAVGLLGELNVATADLHRELARHDDDGLDGDGVTLTPGGVELAAQVIAGGIYGVMHA